MIERERYAEPSTTSTSRQELKDAMATVRAAKRRADPPREPEENLYDALPDESYEEL